MIHCLTRFLYNYLKCGIIGWCMEIMFTALHTIKSRNYKLIGNTSLWMFPIYGCAAFISLLYRFIKKYPFWIRGITYTVCIFSMEYISGCLLKHYEVCPWSYKGCKHNINDVIRLDYAPLWFGAGLFYEQILSRSNTGK